jgi:hypothetical protein
MPRRLKLEGLQADLAAVDSLLKQAIETGDPVGEYQFSARKEALQTSIEEIIYTEEKRASVALFFGGDPVLGSRGISAEFAGNILEKFQDLVSKNFAKLELGTLGERGPIPLQQATKLMVTEVAKGSFGFVLDELSDQMEIENTALKYVVEDVATILERTASPNELDFEEVAESLDSRMLIALRDLFITLDSAKATIRVVEDVADFTLDEQSIHRARQRTEATSIDENDIEIEGALEGFLPDHRKFELRVDEANIVYGSVTKKAAEQYSDFRASGETPIGEKWKVRIRKRIVSPLNRPPREINRLLEFLGRA